MNIYNFFQNLTILCTFGGLILWSGLILGSGLVAVFGVDRFDHRFGSGNFGTTMMLKDNVHFSLYLM